MLAPQLTLHLNRISTEVLSAETSLQQASVSMGLPKEVEVRIEAFDQQFVNRHHYTGYRMFTVQHKLVPAPSNPSPP